MAAITITVEEELKQDIDHFSWVNWSEVAREEVVKDLEKSAKLSRVLQIVSKSKFTENDADLLAVKVKESLYRQLKQEGLI